MKKALLALAVLGILGASGYAYYTYRQSGPKFTVTTSPVTRGDVVDSVGATGTLRQRRGLHWITVMGDVPPPTLKAFAEALQRKR